MRSRLAIIAMLVFGMVLSTGGGALAVSGFSSQQDNAAVSQYGGDEGEDNGDQGVLGERRQRALELVPALDALERLGAARHRMAPPLDRPALGRRPARVVAQQVHRDRVEPRPLRALPRVVAPARAQRALERVREQVLGQRAVAGAVGQEAVEALGLPPVQPVEVRFAHR